MTAYLSAVTLLASVSLASAQDRADGHWVGTWATAVVAQSATAGGALATSPPVFSNLTLRQVVRVSLGGTRVRVVLSNTYGTLPLELGAAQLSRRAADASIIPSSSRQLTFGGRTSVTIPAGALIASDPVTVTVPPLSDLLIDLYVPGDTAALGSPLTTHTAANQNGYVSTPGNHAGVRTLPVQTTVGSWYFLSRVDVAAPRDVGAVVLFGDSITDGSGSRGPAGNPLLSRQHH